MLVVLPVAKVGSIQLTGAERLVAEGRNQRLVRVAIPGYRGAIVDRHGADLAVSVPRRTVAVDMQLLRMRRGPLRDEMARRLARGLGLETDEVVRRLDAASNRDRWVLIGRNVPPHRVAATRAMLGSKATKAWLAGVPDDERVHVRPPKGQREQSMQEVGNILAVEETSQRIHPAGESALRVVGKLSADGTAARGAGIERLQDKVLSGRDGWRSYERGTQRETIAGSERLGRPARPGSDVQLTLDRTIQFEVERILARGAANASARRGVAIVGRPASGELLAVASVQRDEETKQMRLSDSAVAFDSAYQAGSVFKLVTIAAATEAGLVHTDTEFAVPGSIQVYDRTFSDHDAHGVLRMTVKDILAKSSNVGTIKIAQQLGRQRLHDALVKFGFGAQTGVGSPVESNGILPPVSEWTPPDLAASAIGTHVSGTPIQIWSAYNVIANRGRYVPPRLLDAVVDPAGRRAPFPARPVRPVISPASAAEVTTALQAVVEEGTARQWSLPGYPVAAKTGTSRMPSPRRVNAKDGYMWADGRRHYVTTFTGFFPVDHPQVSITVMLEDTPPGSSGSATAGPVFSDLAHLAIRELAIAPSSASAPTTTAPAARQGARRTVVVANGPVRAAPAVAGVIEATERTGANRASRTRRTARSYAGGASRSTSRSVSGGTGHRAGGPAPTPGGSTRSGSGSATMGGSRTSSGTG